MLLSLECIDLLDTSKEILKGAMSAGFLTAAVTKVANQAVESVTRLLLSRPAPAVPEASLTRISNTPFHWETMIANLKAADGTSSSSQDDPTHDRLNADELKMLIAHFKTLTVTQQFDLINCLRRIEEKHQHKYPNNQNDHPSHHSSPLSKKFHTSASIPRYPALLEMTGLSEKDLKSYGVHLEEIDVPHSNQRTKPPPLVPVGEFEPVPEKPFRVVPIDPRLNSASYRMQNQVSHQQQNSPSSSESIYVNQQLRHSNPTSMDSAQQNTRVLHQNLGDASNAQKSQLAASGEEYLAEEPDFVLIVEESFYNEALDPRRNKNLHQNMPEMSPSDLPDVENISVGIPISPVKLQSVGSSPEQVDVRTQQLAKVFKPASSDFILCRENKTVGKKFW